MYYEIFKQMRKQLAQVETWLDKATEYAKTKNFDPNVFVGMRLAPDQFPFARQVQIVCDTPKLGISRITGKEAPAHADTEQTIDELRARIKSVLAYLDGFTAQDFESASSRTVTQPRWEGKVMTTHDYLLEHVMPNFYFHLATVYALLRHNGVPVGKRDYLGSLSQRMP